jgi:hypothetical protein
MVGCRNSGGAGIQQHPAIGILTAPESNDIWPSLSDAGKPNSGWNWPESGHGQKPVRSGQIRPLIRLDLAKIAGIRQQQLDVAGFLLQLHFRLS